jgi:hypothetical protein
MELERLKSAWQKQFVGGDPLLSPTRLSRSLQYLRTSTIRDLQGSEEWVRLVFSFLFALLAVGVSLISPTGRPIMPAMPARIVAWLFAAALLFDAVIGFVLLVRRYREPATTTILAYVSKEHHHIQTRLQFERYSQTVMLTLAAIAIVLVIFSPQPAEYLDSASDSLWRMAVATAFLAVAWRRVRSRSQSTEFRRELEGFLEDLKG